MNKTVKEVAKLAGVSVRTLHYYDEIGLLRPSLVTRTGYRLYDDTALERLMQILFFRELDFSLKDIQKILDDTSFDRFYALERQKELLIMKRDRLDRLIDLAEHTLKGDHIMRFDAFDQKEIEKRRQELTEEAKQLWGNTKAWRESAERTEKYQKEDWQRIQGDADNILHRLALHLHESPSEEIVQQLIAEWQNHISKNYYTCTNDLLSSLGELYVTDERFTQSLDERYGIGIAKFINSAIKEYCKN